MAGSVATAAASGTFPIGGDLPIHRLGFGAMRIVGEGVWGPPANRQQMIELVRRVPELGINFIDTADSYGPFISEEIIGEALYPYGEDMVIATKAGLTRTGPGEWEPNGRPEHLRERCEGSLARLKLERIDLFQLHRIDPEVPAADQFGALKELQEEGKIRHVGLSEVSVANIEEARETLDVVSVQNKYNLAEREYEDVVDYCEREGIAFIPWYPLNAGPLTDESGPLSGLMEELDATPAQLALAWLLHRSPVIVPIPGTSSRVHLEENTAAAGIRLDRDAMDRLDALV